MDNQKENMFLEKFRLLNSQEQTEDINWSSSCDSDYENTLKDTSSNQILKTRIKKRKRKEKAPKNLSNLSITILDTSREKNKMICQEKSPILSCKSRPKIAPLSPIINPVLSFQQGKTVTSPIISPNTIRLKSPIIDHNTGSQKSAVKVRKKLFNIENFNENIVNVENLPKQSKQEKSTIFSVKLEEDYAEETRINSCGSSNSEEMGENLAVNGEMSQAKSDLAKRVKSFFDSHFSSENASVASQISISDILSPKNSTKSSDEIDIFNSKTPVLSNSNSIPSLKPEDSTNSSESSLYIFNKNSKKIRYKKDGLANRLNNLLKKQNASLSLWQHERFLAANSNFVIPKGEFTMFRMQTVNFKYGCYLIEAVDVNDDKYIILINSLYVSDSIVSKTVLQLYEPFQILPYSNDCKLITNVTKFECSDYKS